MFEPSSTQIHFEQRIARHMQPQRTSHQPQKRSCHFSHPPSLLPHPQHHKQSMRSLFVNFCHKLTSTYFSSLGSTGVSENACCTRSSKAPCSSGSCTMVTNRVESLHRA
eukprot:GABV01010365.1.p1 GENE.GABV01010365.1~~GABV01010365.1.p1  ORF type:complete len:123 (-),score=23.80 GABV01010365.1:143-469(-)